MTSGIKLCPACGLDHVIPQIDGQTMRTVGFECEWCGEEWGAAPAALPTVLVDGNVVTLPRRDPERGGQVQ